jgi:serine/threonine-protein kinase
MNSFDCPHCHYTFTCPKGATGVVYCPECSGGVVLPDSELPTGTVIDDFEIVNLIGRGGMGNVYKARQISMDRLVAVKILLEELTRDKEYLIQFFKEVKVSGKLHHPNITSAISAGECNGLFYLATTFVDGEDLDRRLQREPFIPEKEALTIVKNVADALKYAWDNFAMLHKDIKPANIMLNQKDEVFLMDMGIAQFMSDGSGGEENVQGSPYYMSPEQVSAAPLSWSSDLYSLGATLYHMVVGKPIFDAPEVQHIIHMQAYKPFPDPNEASSFYKISEPTVNLLRTALEKKPINRFDSWMGFIEAVDDAIYKLEHSNEPEKKTFYEDGDFIQKKKNKNRKKHSHKTRHNTKSSINSVKKTIARKKSSGNGTTLIILVAILLLCSVVYFLYTTNRNTAIIAYNKALLIDNSNKSYDEKIRVFREALMACQGTGFSQKIKLRYDELIKERNTQKQLAENYKKAKEQALLLAADGNYKDAILLIKNAGENIKDPLLIQDIQSYLKLLQDGMRKK